MGGECWFSCSFVQIDQELNGKSVRNYYNSDTAPATVGDFEALQNTTVMSLVMGRCDVESQVRRPARD